MFSAYLDRRRLAVVVLADAIQQLLLAHLTQVGSKGQEAHGKGRCMCPQQAPTCWIEQLGSKCESHHCRRDHPHQFLHHATSICMEPLLERAGQRAAEVELQAAQDIEAFASQQMAEAEATEGFASAPEVAAGAAETAAAAGGGALAALGEPWRWPAPRARQPAVWWAALVGTAWAIQGGVNAASHMLGWGVTTDVQTLNGMQESGQWTTGSSASGASSRPGVPRSSS